MKQRKQSKKKKQSKIQLQTYHSTDGDTILVGKIINKMIILPIKGT